jgi:hypothetical protein
MKRKIWITKNWKFDCCITIWFIKPVWCPNVKKPCEKDSGHWSNKDGTGLEGSHSLFHDAFNGLFKVSFKKKPNEGFIAERVIFVRKLRRLQNITD